MGEVLPILGRAFRRIDPASGREIFIKKDGTQTFEHDYADEVVVGNSDPKVEGVIGTSFYYKGFSASVNLQVSLGRTNIYVDFIRQGGEYFGKCLAI